MAGGKGKGQLSVKRKYSEEKEGWLHDLHQRSPHLTARQVFEKAQNENKKGFTQSIINQLWSDKRKKTQGAPVEQSQDVLDREQDLNVECGHDGTTQHDHVGSSGWSRTETTISANSVTLGNDPKPSQYIAAQTIPRSEVVHQDATTRAGSGFRKSQWLTNKEVTMAMERLSTGVCEILPSRSFNSRRPVSLHGFPSTLGAVLNIDNVHLALVVIVYKADSPSSIYFYDSSPRSWSKRILEIVENFTTRAANVEFDRPEEHVGGVYTLDSSSD
jgi:hypothetical protein